MNPRLAGGHPNGSNGPFPQPGELESTVPKRQRRRIRGTCVRTLIVGALVSFGALGAAACGDDKSSDEGASGEASSNTTPRSGEETYQQTCALCHGNDLRGTSMGPSHLSKVYEPSHHSDASFVSAIRNGSPEHHWNFGDMPPVKGISDEEIEAVIAFVREKQTAEGFEPYPPS